ncbi:DegQ protease [Sulfuriferula plumbiphila]|uniref:DegQ protease n=2 Tax=Sulfuriferula plumbiphila TaxID=171865 RepID=A0A512LB63_9PROT|nr:DegQ protease [Sulfuriferula plumbiphila]GEP31723.1 DegQ protease [Sulfuriferula plumbiphila]
MMRKFWLIFAQSTTIALGMLFVVVIFRPDWLTWRNVHTGPGVTIREVVAPGGGAQIGSLSAAAKKAIPSVVNVFTSKEVRLPRNPLADDPIFKRFFGDHPDSRSQRVNNLGSGVIVSADGYILTNHHVVEAADEIQVALHDGRTVPARVVGSDPETDLAVLKVNLTGLPAISFAQPDKGNVGDIVLAIGDPFGVGQTVTMGIISALGRSHLGINTFENFIQTDAAINPGNSGGALVDANGNLIGINSAIYTRTGGSQGIGFAIPVSLVIQVMDQIIKHGSVTRGWVGVEVQDLTPELAESFKLPNTNGALIAGILKGGPADLAGIRPGDVLIDVNDKPVKDSTSLLQLIAMQTPGQTVQLKLLRKAKEMVAVVKIGKRPRIEQPVDDEQ